MTALATISDHSDIANGLRGWAFVLIVIVVGLTVLAVIAVRKDLGNVPVMGDELSRLDLADRHQCGINHCTYPGIVLRLSAADLGLESTWVCVGHSNEGDLRKWWAS